MHLLPNLPGQPLLIFPNRLALLIMRPSLPVPSRIAASISVKAIVNRTAAQPDDLI
jgi:hypothetical protein